MSQQKPKGKTQKHKKKVNKKKNSDQFEEQVLQKGNSAIIQDPDVVLAVSPVIDVQEKINEYQNAKIVQNLKNFQKSYTKYRQIRGDGNCFFRAVAFYFFEHILVQSNEQQLKLFENSINQKTLNLRIIQEDTIPPGLIKFYQDIENKLLVNLRQIQKLVNNKQINITQKIFDLQELFKKDPSFDFSIIVFFRAKLFASIDLFQDQFKDYYSGSEKFELSQYGEEAQGCVVKLTADVFQVNLSINEVSREEWNSYNYKPENSHLQQTSKDYEIILFFRPGHYDLCYTKEYYDKNYSGPVVAHDNEIYYEQSFSENSFEVDLQQFHDRKSKITENKKQKEQQQYEKEIDIVMNKQKNNSKMLEQSIIIDIPNQNFIYVKEKEHFYNIEIIVKNNQIMEPIHKMLVEQNTSLSQLQENIQQWIQKNQQFEDPVHLFIYSWKLSCGCIPWKKDIKFNSILNDKLIKIFNKYKNTDSNDREVLQIGFKVLQKKVSKSNNKKSSKKIKK